MIETHIEQIRKCDVCGKEEGKHLKAADFYTKPPCLLIKNYEGKELHVVMNVFIDNYDDDHGILDDVADSYMDIHNKSIPMIQMFQIGNPPTMVDTDNEDSGYEDDYVICKKCFTFMVDIISKFGKFDKIEVF